MSYKKIPLIIITGIVVFIFLSLVLGYCIFFTERGLNFFTKIALSYYTKSEDVEIKKIERTLPQSLSFHDISLENLKYMPPGTMLEIKKADIYINPFRIEESNLSVHNGRIKIPDSDPVLFHGDYKDGILDFNIYSKNIDIRQIAGFIKDRVLKDITGNADNVDIYIKGRLFEPEVTGGFHISNLLRRGFSISDCPVSFELNLKEIMTGPKIYGDVTLDSGQISGPKTAAVKLVSGRISFSGKPDAPVFDFKGVSNIEGIKINIELKGTVEKPDLKLSSEPFLPRGMLLLMLATNKNWKGVEGLLNQGQISPDIVKDFIDYFFFAGTGAKIARHFGINGILLRYDDKTKSIGVRKDIGGKAEVNYSVEQPQAKEEKPVTTHKIGSEVKVTDAVSVEAERELKEDTDTVKEESKLQSNDKVLLKYKKQF